MVGLLFFFFFFSQALQNEPGNSGKKKSQPVCQKLWPSRGRLCRTERENSRNFIIYINTCMFFSSTPGKNFRERSSYLPRFLHLHLPLSREVTGPTLRDYLTRPPKQTEASGVSGRLPPARGAGGTPAGPARRGQRAEGRGPGAAPQARAHCGITTARTAEVEPALLRARRREECRPGTVQGAELSLWEQIRFGPAMALGAGVGIFKEIVGKMAAKISWRHRRASPNRPKGSPHRTSARGSRGVRGCTGRERGLP